MPLLLEVPTSIKESCSVEITAQVDILEELALRESNEFKLFSL